MRKKKILKLILAFLGLYVAYFITGMMLTKRGVVDEWWIFPNTVIKDSQKQDIPAGTDGPHIFYKDSLIIAKSVIQHDTTYIGVTDTFYNRDSVIINCRFDEHPEWNFSTRLKDSLLIEPSTYPEPDSLVAISDIEGEFEAFRKLLIANRVMNAGYHWTFGTGHLALVGDFFDRGIHVTETLWLIYHLEQEAATAGGKVHFILGNHELMNMSDDIRYVSPKYIKNTYLIQANYKIWFKQGTELGNWLATKNVIEQIGGILLVHGGISKEVNKLSLNPQAINDKCRSYYFTARKELAAKAGADIHSLLGDDKSLTWFRGYVQETATDEQVDNTLKSYSANKIVVGHTKVKEVTTFYEGKVIAIDTRHAKNESQGLLYKEGSYYIIDTTGKRYKL